MLLVRWSKIVCRCDAISEARSGFFVVIARFELNRPNRWPSMRIIPPGTRSTLRPGEPDVHELVEQVANVVDVPADKVGRFGGRQAAAATHVL